MELLLLSVFFCMYKVFHDVSGFSLMIPHGDLLLLGKPELLFSHATISATNAHGLLLRAADIRVRRWGGTGKLL